MNLDKIEKLVKIIENSSMLDFSIQEGDVKIKMSRRGSVGAPAAPMSVSTQGVDTVESIDSEDESYITSPIVGTFYLPSNFGISTIAQFPDCSSAA